MKTEPTEGKGAAVTGPLLVVADDDESMRLLLARILESEGWRVACADGGAQAIEALRTGAPDLLILDLMMPGTSGWDVLAFMDGRPSLARVPVVVLTAFAERSDGAWRDVGAPSRRMIHKPVDADLLLRLVGGLLDRARAASQLHA